MVDYVIGLLLLGLGLKPHPAVLGQHDEQETQVQVSPTQATTTSDTVSTITPTTSEHETSGTNPEPTKNEPTKTERRGNDTRRTSAFTENELKAFQAERKQREQNIKKVSDSREKELETDFETAKKDRIASDSAAKKILENKIKTFRDGVRKQKVFAIADKFQTVTTNRLSKIQTKLSSLMSLLDKITAAAGALQSQGKDTTALDADITIAQTKVSGAMSLLNTTTAQLPTTFTVSSESAVQTDITSAIARMKQSLLPLEQAFGEARSSVGKVLSELEALTGTQTGGTP